MSLKKSQMFMKKVISTEYVVLANTVFYKNFIFDDKYIILATLSFTPTEAKVLL